jgi:hypothetical protein
MVLKYKKIGTITQIRKQIEKDSKILFLSMYQTMKHSISPHFSGGAALSLMRFSRPQGPYLIYTYKLILVGKIGNYQIIPT